MSWCSGAYFLGFCTKIQFSLFSVDEFKTKSYLRTCNKRKLRLSLWVSTFPQFNLLQFFSMSWSTEKCSSVRCLRRLFCFPVLSIQPSGAKLYNPTNSQTFCLICRQVISLHISCSNGVASSGATRWTQWSVMCFRGIFCSVFANKDKARSALTQLKFVQYSINM